ncbi:MAG TPA: chromate transporter [Candidatus Caccocola faecipullorum]|nr:chromate transporter [Candidatus Caccocola faecipullorum]
MGGSAMKKTGGALRLFVQFLKFGCFTFGGGLNIVAQMQRLYVDEEKKITNVELLDLTGVARSLPGLFVGNVAFLYGYRDSGYPGAFAAIFGMVIPPMIVLSFITYFYTEFHSQATVMSAMTGVRAAVVPIMASAILGLVRGAFPMRICYAVAAAALGLYLFLHVNCVWLVAGGAAAGLIISRFWKGGRGDGAA